MLRKLLLSHEQNAGENHDINMDGLGENGNERKKVW